MIDPLKELIAQQLHANADKLSETTNITEDLGADSLDIVKLLMAIEKEYNISIPDETAAKLKTVGELAEYLSGHSGDEGRAE